MAQHPPPPFSPGALYHYFFWLHYWHTRKSWHDPGATMMTNKHRPEENFTEEGIRKKVCDAKCRKVMIRHYITYFSVISVCLIIWVVWWKEWGPVEHNFINICISFFSRLQLLGSFFLSQVSPPVCVCASSRWRMQNANIILSQEKRKRNREEMWRKSSTVVQISSSHFSLEIFSCLVFPSYVFLDDVLIIKGKGEKQIFFEKLQKYV